MDNNFSDQQKKLTHDITDKLLDQFQILILMNKGEFTNLDNPNKVLEVLTSAIVSFFGSSMVYIVEKMFKDKSSGISMIDIEIRQYIIDTIDETIRYLNTR